MADVSGKPLESWAGSDTATSSLQKKLHVDQTQLIDVDELSDSAFYKFISKSVLPVRDKILSFLILPKSSAELSLTRCESRILSSKSLSTARSNILKSILNHIEFLVSGVKVKEPKEKKKRKIDVDDGVSLVKNEKKQKTEKISTQTIEDSTIVSDPEFESDNMSEDQQYEDVDYEGLYDQFKDKLVASDDEDIDDISEIEQSDYDDDELAFSDEDVDISSSSNKTFPLVNSNNSENIKGPNKKEEPKKSKKFKEPREPKQDGNRMGQRARQKLWEKMYGEEARHMKKRKESGIEVKKPEKVRKVVAGERGSKMRPPAPKAVQKSEKLHPSWEAKLQQKKQQAKNALVFSTPKKIVFGDDGSAKEIEYKGNEIGTNNAVTSKFRSGDTSKYAKATGANSSIVGKFQPGSVVGSKNDQPVSVGNEKIHPSWEAKKKQKEALKSKLSSAPKATKIIFD
ncbi:hypothetical protein HK096_003101 [Nowakowskiella sp. JEL0078]|nr:hypothetical protein HK096_003101 [Nowakowskiella sp. JEL0078]